MNCWQILGIDPTDNKRDIKRAYSRLLKDNHPEDKPEAFQQLRDAYDQALAMAEFVVDEVEDEDAPNPDDTDQTAQPMAQPVHDYLEPATEVPDRQLAIDAESARIDQVVADIIKRLDVDSQQAIEFLSQILKEEDFEALDIRYELEGRLLERLVQQLRYDFEFTRFLEKAFHWRMDLNNPHDILVNHFHEDSDYHWSYQRYAKIYLNDLIRRQVTNHFSNKLSAAKFRQYQQLEALLFYPDRFEQLKQFCRQDDHQKLAKKVHQYLQQQGLREYQIADLPVNNINILMQQTLKPDNESQDTRKAIVYWLIFMFVAHLIFYSFKFAMNKDEDTTPKEKTALVEETKPIASDDGAKRLISQSHLNQKLQALRPLAENGDAQSLFAVALYDLYNTDNPGNTGRDDAASIAMLEQAAAQHHADALRVLGILYLYGDKVERNVEKGHQYLQQAVDLDNVVASRQLALEYLDGGNLQPDYEMAAELLAWIPDSEKRPLDAFWLEELFRHGYGLQWQQQYPQEVLNRLQASASDNDINQFAWELSVLSTAGISNGTLAIKLMHGILSKGQSRNWAYFDTLAAAYARTGQFVDAVRNQQKAIKLLPENVSPAQLALIQVRLMHYQNHQSYRERLNFVSIRDMPAFP
ncbi:SEL1-like repeat protein [Gynuella sunshinyii]|uniref:TPR repeat, SEL1 subfamily n=1 Tax=Gynuella sunshinyii YC6258 TaxID=1445510 RepID=A0A0C5VR05_9GAMM|nr:SEL1-like repeat protein [Gynuella sunshinyii]AJQ92679.1 TPR repeat, SEL1 subfamily [Gynuella sunshinyii YC6258]